MNNNRPIVFNPAKERLADFRKRHKVAAVIDTYEEQLKDLFLIRNPPQRFNPQREEMFEAFLASQGGRRSLKTAGCWFYFPWNRLLVHYLAEDAHQELRTARNKNLITKSEQSKLYNATIGVAGLSVGSHAALTIAMMGAGRVMKLADPDVVSGSNLNRIRYDFTTIGTNKCALAARIIYQMNPYGAIHQYPMGVTPENIGEFLAGPPKLDILIEAMDNLALKIQIRLEAKKLGIPVIMATDNGDNVIVDVERYDLDPNLEIFNGAAGHLTLEEFQKFPPQEIPKLATKIAGPRFVVPRMLESLLEVGRILYSWPQLGDAATLAGVALAYATKRIALGQPIKTGKFEVNLDAMFNPDYNNPSVADKRNTARRKLLTKIGLA